MGCYAPIGNPGPIITGPTFPGPIVIGIPSPVLY